MTALQYGEIINVDALSDYLLKRRNSDGGFCFYSLDESNLNDTFYAVLILNMLDRLPSDGKTIDFIRSFQDERGGGFYSVYSAWCVLNALRVLKAEPKSNTDEYVLGLLDRHRILDNIYIESLSIFESSYYLADMLVQTGYAGRCDKIADEVLRYRKDDGSFGHGDPSLISTYYALAILKLAGRSPDEFSKTVDFVNSNAVESGGFSKKPLTGLAFMDETYYSIMMLEMLGEKPHNCRETIGFIDDCQNDNGGFRRARASGISGFDTSYYAMETLRALLNI